VEKKTRGLSRSIAHFTLKEGAECAAGKLDVRISEENNCGSLDIFLAGLGTKTMQPGCGSVMHLELYDGKPMLRVWADINNEEPTHVIDLSGAAETLLRDSKP
jgi:hypothetical protein